MNPSPPFRGTMSRACWSSNNIYRKQFLGCLLVEGRRTLSESSRRVQDGGTQGAEEKTGAIATLEGPEFLRFAFGRGGVDASMKLTQMQQTQFHKNFSINTATAGKIQVQTSRPKLKVHLFLHTPIEKVRSLRWTWCF